MDESDESETWVKLISEIELFDCCFQMEVLTGEEGTEDEEEEEEEEEDDEVIFFQKKKMEFVLWRFYIL